MKNLLAILLIFSHIITASEIKEMNDPLITLINLQEQLPTEINHWEVIIKENIPKKATYENILKEMQDNPALTTREGHAPGSFVHEIVTKENSLTITEQVISSDEQAGVAERIIILNGNQFNEKVKKDYEKQIKKFFQKIDKENSKTYTCLHFIDDGTIESGTLLAKYTSELQLIHSTIEEDTLEKSMVKKLIYGYTPLWNSFFSMNGKPYNLQIAVLNQTDDKSEYVIGTPILLNEY